MPVKISSLIIADDDPDDLDFYREVLTEVCPNLDLTIALNGRVLLQQLDNCLPPQLIVLDINMPYVNGIQCLKHIRSKQEFDNTYVVMLSTSASSKEISICTELGANYYYLKPSTIHGLKDIVTDFIDGGIHENKYRKFSKPL